MRREEAGFTMIELAIVILLMGLLLTFSIPALNRFSQSQQLVGSSQSISSQLRLARERAIATGVEQVFCFVADSAGSDYHVHGANGAVVGRWPLPRGIDVVSPAGATRLVIAKDGTFSNSLTLVLEDRQAVRDTLGVQVSGLVLTR